MTPRKASAYREIKDRRKEEILEAAIKVFATKGYHAAKISDIVSEAGISQGLVYRYFRSKDDLFSVLVKRAYEYSYKFLKERSKGEGTPLEKISDMIEKTVEALSSKEFSYYTLISIQAVTSEDMPKKVKGIIQKPHPIMELLMQKILEGQKTGEIVKKDPFFLAYTLSNLILGFAISSFPGREFPCALDMETILKMLKA